ncbi:MAG: hypothetical protein JSV17_06055 [Candidatus Aminicenantes bacterium]|nr:MAG: hypothetical protein JSV17_06055 [Candidatus Aminicenantes bacterium]
MAKQRKNSLPYSDKLGKLEGDVERFKREYLQMWWQTPTAFPELGNTYPETEQKTIETELFRFLDRTALKLDDYPDTKTEQKAWMEKFIAEVRDFGRKFLEMSDLYLDSVFQDDAVRSTRMFVDKAKTFDPTLQIEDLYQALRNAWIMNSLQMYLNLDVKYHDSLFAYSMIYPYMDNYLDDVSLSLEEKLVLIKKLRDGLEGWAFAPENRNEEKILQLIKMIESEYDRKKFPGVYQSLLAIFNAQLRSLTQQKGHTLPFEGDILDLSFEKGGTSVLADGYLVSGTLEEHQANFCFGFGAFLQLADDIQDLIVDQQNDHATIFSLPAGRYSLDNLANKLMNFIAETVDVKLDEQNSNAMSLKELILRNCTLLILEAIGKNKGCYSREYLNNMERHFPIRFSSLKKLQKKLRKKILGKRRHVIDLELAAAFLLTTTSRIISGK